MGAGEPGCGRRGPGLEDTPGPYPYRDGSYIGMAAPLAGWVGIPAEVRELCALTTPHHGSLGSPAHPRATLPVLTAQSPELRPLTPRVSHRVPFRSLLKPDALSPHHSRVGPLRTSLCLLFFPLGFKCSRLLDAMWRKPALLDGGGWPVSREGPSTPLWLMSSSGKKGQILILKNMPVLGAAECLV